MLVHNLGREKSHLTFMQASTLKFSIWELDVTCKTTKKHHTIVFAC